MYDDKRHASKMTSFNQFGSLFIRDDDYDKSYLFFRIICTNS